MTFHVLIAVLATVLFVLLILTNFVMERERALKLTTIVLLLSVLVVILSWIKASV